MQFRAGHPQTVGAVEGLAARSRNADRRRRTAAVRGDGRRRAEQHTAQRLDTLSAASTAWSSSETASAVRTLVERLAGLGGQHQRPPIHRSAEPSCGGVSVRPSANSTTSTRTPNSPSAERNSSGVLGIGVHHEAVVPAHRILTGQRRQCAVAVTGQRQTVGGQRAPATAAPDPPAAPTAPPRSPGRPESACSPTAVGTRPAVAGAPQARRVHEIGIGRYGGQDIPSFIRGSVHGYRARRRV